MSLKIINNLIATPLGILGGTFDPVHLGHIHLSLEVLKQLPISKIKLIPCYEPVHREHPEASVAQRVKMLELAVKPYSDLEVDCREIDRKEPSFMYDTLISLHKDYPQTSLSLIMGADAYQHLPSWKEWQHLLDYAHFIVINRPDIKSNVHPNSILVSHESSHPNDIVNQTHGKVLFLQIPPCDISATQVRNRIRKGTDISSLVPTTVAAYIQEQQLYK